jgi:hypothetical protein
MMQQVVQDGHIPQEVFAKTHSHCDHAILTKQLFYNSSRTLHHPAGLGECNFGDCYAHAAHTPTSITIQSWSIPKSAIRVLLSLMQTMQYILKTGFGKSEECYGGTESILNSGLGQGSRASPLMFIALNSLLINSYHWMGHGAKIPSSYFGCLFYLSVVMYVDDTDLLHWTESPATNPKELIEFVQWATMDYGCLAQATGGILKEKKCSNYFVAYKFVCGRAKMKSLHDLSPPREYVTDDVRIYPSHISIPQPEGPDVPIEKHNATTALKMLGICITSQGEVDA